MTAPTVKKQDLDPNCYPLNYVPNYGEDAPALMNNLIPKAAPLTKGDTKEDKGEDAKEDKGEDKDDGTQMEEDSGEVLMMMISQTPQH